MVRVASVSVTSVSVTVHVKNVIGDSVGLCCGFILIVLIIGFFYWPFWAASRFRDDYNKQIFEKMIGRDIISLSTTYSMVLLGFLIILACILEDLIYPIWVFYTLIPFFSFNETYFVIVQFIMAFLLLFCNIYMKRSYYYTTAKLLPCFCFLYYYIFAHMPLYLYLIICSLSVLLCFMNTKKENSSDISV